MKKNTPQLWDEVWKDNYSIEKDNLALEKEENCIRWQRIEKIVIREFGSFNNLKVIEMGAGIGTNAALMARRGAICYDLSFNLIILLKLYFLIFF